MKIVVGGYEIDLHRGNAVESRAIAGETRTLAKVLDNGGVILSFWVNENQRLDYDAAKNEMRLI